MGMFFDGKGEFVGFIGNEVRIRKREEKMVVGERVEVVEWEV